jgi:aminopeptidase YwaD
MISLEMIGYHDPRPGSQDIPSILKPFYPNTGDFLALVGASGCGKILKCAEASYKRVPGSKVRTLSLPGKGRLLPAVRLSDHAPFWDAGFPALLVTDTSFFRNPHYHRPSDTIETLDLDFLCRTTEGTFLFLRDFTEPLL